MSDIKLEFVGPFGWSENRGVPNIFDSPLATERGVYLWTVQTPDGDELVFYIGQARGFGERFKEHYKLQSDGSYRIYDPATFILGQKNPPLWGGKYGDDKEPREDFQNRFDRVKSQVPRFLGIIRFHLAPISAVQASGMEPKEFRCRVEAALAYAFYCQPGRVSALLEGDIYFLECSSFLQRQELRNLKWPPRDATTRILITSQTKICGLPAEVLV